MQYSPKTSIAYIAHPVGGDVEANLANLRKVIRSINNSERHTVPFCPYYADAVSMNDNDPEQRARAIANGLAILGKPGMVDELRLYGETITEGMKGEITVAHTLGIPIISSSTKLYHELAPILEDLYRKGGIGR